MDKYYIFNFLVEMEKILGRTQRKKTKNDYELDLYIEHRDKNYWVISEAKTGLKICEGRTQKATIENLMNYSNSTMPNFSTNKLKKFIKEFGLSPFVFKRRIISNFKQGG